MAPKNRPMRRERQAYELAMARAHQQQQNLSNLALAAIAAGNQASNNMAAAIAANAQQGQAATSAIMAMAMANMNQQPPLVDPALFDDDEEDGEIVLDYAGTTVKAAPALPPPGVWANPPAVPPPAT